MDDHIRKLIREEMGGRPNTPQVPKPLVQNYTDMDSFRTIIREEFGSGPKKKPKPKAKPNPKKLLALEKGRLTKKMNSGKGTEEDKQRLEEITQVLLSA